MTQARVTSLDALRKFREALCVFGEKAQEALIGADMEIRRTFDELHERLKHWHKTVHTCEHKVAEAKIELNRKKISHFFGHQPDSTEQEENLRKAKGRLHRAEERTESCRRWEPKLRQAVLDYEGPARQLSGRLDHDLPRALAVLDQKIAALEAYLHIAPPEAPAPIPAGDAASVANQADSATGIPQLEPEEAGTDQESALVIERPRDEMPVGGDS
jgi:hypothetical protein